MELSCLLFLLTGSLIASLFILKHYLTSSTKPSLPTNQALLHSIHTVNPCTDKAHTSESEDDHDDPLHLYAQIQANGDQQSLDAIEFIKSILTQYTVSQLSFSFNGGKDCIVLLYLIRIALKLLNKKDSDLEIIWFQRNNEFPQLIEFLRYCVKKYQFPLFETCNDYKSGLHSYLKNGNRLCRGVFLGQRLTDPYCNNLHLSTHCSNGWPDIMRINPILYWCYNDIFRFLLRYNLEYCCLYDQGYTSLGDIKETIPNPLLYDRHLFKFNGANYLNKYQYAERFGRLIKNKNALITDKIKCLIVGELGKDTNDANGMRNNIKLAIESSFVKEKVSVEIEVMASDDNDERLKWCKKRYMYTFYANIAHP